MSIIKKEIKTLNQWLQFYDKNDKQEETINNFLYFSNIRNVLNNNLIKGRIAMQFLEELEEWEQEHTYNSGDKVLVYKKKNIIGNSEEKEVIIDNSEEKEVIIDYSIWISNTDNNTGHIPSFENRSYWGEIPAMAKAEYISNESILFAINTLKVKLPQVYGHIGTFGYEKKYAYQLLGLFVLAYLYYYNRYNDINNNGVNDALIASKNYHNTSYTAVVPEYQQIEGMEIFQTPFGRLMFNTLIDIVRHPYLRMA